MLSGTIYDAAAVAAAVTLLVSLLKPYIELLPFARPDAPAHDSTLRLLNVLLNVGVALLLAANRGQLSGFSWTAVVLTGLGQASGSQLLYTATTTTSGKHQAAKKAKAVPATHHVVAPTPAAAFIVSGGATAAAAAQQEPEVQVAEGPAL